MGRLTNVVVCAVFAAGCTEGDDRLEMENVLELRLGDDNPPLSQALGTPRPAANGSQPSPPRRDPDQPGAQRRPAESPPSRRAAIPPSRPPVDPTPDPEVEVSPATPPRDAKPQPAQPQPEVKAFRTVTLKAGETLYGLCQKHLNRGGAWREVAKLNGWTEAQAGNLPEGQVVKLPQR